MENKVGNALKMIGKITWFLGAILAVLCGIITESFLVFIYIIIASFLGGLFYYAVGEVITLLQDITDGNTSTTPSPSDIPRL
jgi:hypothetical protein